jgi:uncharacterized protein
MRLRNDPKVGLDYEVDLPDTTAGNDTYVLTKRGDLKSASMGFVAYQEEFRHEGSTLVRHLLSMQLTEISPTRHRPTLKPNGPTTFGAAIR